MSRATQKSQKPFVALSKVPSVKQLCEQLGFQRASIKDTDKFMDATRTWRRSYKTSDDFPASRLLHWNDPAVQTELKGMAEKFLEAGDNGERFWGVRREWYHPLDVQFPDESERIVSLLMQLFWKQNKYAFNNSQYGHKLSDSADVSRNTSTPVRETESFHVGGLIGSTAFPEDAIAGPTSPPRNPRVSDSTILSSPNRMISEPTDKQRPRDRDIFEGPDDSDQNTRGDAFDHMARMHRYRVVKKRKREDAIAEGTQPVISSYEPSTKSPNTNRKKKYHLADSPRRTDRKRKQRSIPGAIRDEEFEEILKEQEDVEILDPKQADLVSRCRHEQELPTRQGTFHSRTEGIPKTPPSQKSPPGKAFSAPTAPMTVHITASPSKVRRKTEGSSLEVHTETFSGLLSRKPHSIVSTGGPSSEVSAMREIVVISPIEGEDDPISRPLFSQRTETNREPPPFPPPAEATPTGSIPEGCKEDHIHFQGAMLDSITHAQPSGTTENKALADMQERPTAEHCAKHLDALTADHPSERTHTETSVLESSTEEIDIKSLNNATPQPASQVLPQAQPPTQPTSNPLPTQTNLSSSKPRTKTQIPVWIITREPRYTEERWDDGKFSGTPLSAFIAGISQVTQRQYIEKIKLTLRTPMSDTKITVFKDAEDSWISAKETFVEKLKEARLEAKARRQNESLSCKILVEPFCEESMLPSGSIDDDDEEFDF